MALDTHALDTFLHGLFTKKKIPGISVAAWGPDGEMFARGYGRANEDGSRPVDPDTIFGIASMSKSQTALACAILEAEDKLSFTDPVYKYFPAFEVKGLPKDAIQLRHLAMHTAGIPPMEPLEWSIAMHSNRLEDAWVSALRKTAPGPFDTIDQIIEYIANCGYEPLGAPGEIMSYSNEGYALLSYVVDQVAGIPLEQFLAERVYRPLGMTRTLLDEDASNAIKMAGGNITSLFDTSNDVLTCDDEWSVAPPYRGCGWVKSTARDMAAYYRCLSNMGMHEGRQAIPRAAVDALIGMGFAAEKRPTYAYGLNKRAKGGHIFCEHSGGLHGVATHGGLLLHEGWGFAALCNYSDADAEPFVTVMFNWALGWPLETKHRWFEDTGRDFSNPEMVVGTYRSHEGEPVDVIVYRNGSKLVARREGKEYPLVYCGGTMFASIDAEDSVQMRLEALIRKDQAWGVRCGTRVYQRVRE